MGADFHKTLTYAFGVNYKETHHTLRALFIIDPAGKIRHYSMTDLAVGRSVDETYRLVTAFQHVDEHGDLCPANWQKGAKTIEPSKSKEFFSQR